MAELLAPGTSQADSADFTVSAGVPVTLYIKNAAGTAAPSGVDFELHHKTPGGGYIPLITLNSANILDRGVISGGGTFRVRRLQSAVSAGMDYV